MLAIASDLKVRQVMLSKNIVHCLSTKRKEHCKRFETYFTNLLHDRVFIVFYYSAAENRL